jgi:nicotinamidase-related amidase
MRRALLVIDMQEVMRQVLWRGELAERIGQVLAAAHQSGVPVIASSGQYASEALNSAGAAACVAAT